MANSKFVFAPPYLADLVAFREYKRTISSTNISLLFVLKSKRKPWGERAFSVATPKLWNKLPQDLRSITDLSLFKSNFKTILFRQAFNT